VLIGFLVSKPGIGLLLISKASAAAHFRNREPFFRAG
jgi:hypothetical protein